jgi:hypothetical protein
MSNSTPSDPPLPLWKRVLSILTGWLPKWS